MDTQKKQLLEKILEALVPYWDMAEGFLLILEEERNDKMEEKLYEMLVSEIKKIEDQDDRNNIKRILTDIKNKEKKERKGESKYLEDLIDNM